MAESSKRETVLRNLLTTVRNQNENLITELNQVQENIVDNGKLLTKLQNVEKELASKTKFWEFYEDRCLEMKTEYIQQLNDETDKFEKLQKRNQNLERELNTLSTRVKQLESQKEQQCNYHGHQEYGQPRYRRQNNRGRGRFGK